MDWQLGVVGLLVMVAAVYLARRAWRTWSGRKGGCGGGCGCASKSENLGARSASKGGINGSTTWIEADQLRLRRSR